MKPVGQIMRRQHADAATFGHAVDIEELSGPTRQDLTLQFYRARRARAGFGAERRQVVIVETRACQYALELYRHHDRIGNTLKLRQIEEDRCVELVHEYDAASPCQGRKRTHEGRIRI
jgi:hypothetical protein